MDTEKVFNPKSGNFISASSKLGQALRYIEQINSKDELTRLLNKCKSQQVWNPITQKCVKATTKDAQAILAAYEYYLENEVKEFIEKPKKVKGNTCSNYPPRTKPFIPKDNQKRTLDFFIKNYDSIRGLLLFWELGGGKTCGSTLLVDYILSRNEDRDVYILTSAATRENFKREYCTICGENPDELENFKFVSYNYTMLGDKLIDLFDLSRINNAVFVIDEFHNFISGYINESSNYGRLFDLFKSLTDPKFIFMTGTPLLDKLKELFVVGNLLLPEQFISYETFKKKFTLNELGQLIPPDNLKNTLKKFVSRYKPDPEGFPTVNIVRVTVPISSYQFDRYIVERSNEVAVQEPDEKLKVTNLKAYNNQKTRYFLAKIMLKSQAILNCAYPENVKDREDKLVEDGGWIDDNFISNLLVYCPKLYVLVNMLFKYPGKSIVFTRYVKKHGVDLIAAVLKYFGVKSLIFSGDISTDEKRQEVIEAFNSPNNLNGEEYQVLIFTKAGSEGLNLFQTRFVYVFEKYIRTYLEKQADGRAIRFGSHLALPENMRDVTIFELFALTPGPNVDFKDVEENRKTSDFFAYEQAIEKQFRIQPIIDMMNSIEPL